MRITVDSDSKDVLSLSCILLKGLLLLQKLPKEARITSRGYHLIWRAKVTEKRAFLLRKYIGDDMRRIALDRNCPRKPQQILFSEKIVTFNGSVMPELFWKLGIKPRVDFERCPLCDEKGVIKSVKYWTVQKKCIEVHHEDHVCEFELHKRRKNYPLRIIEKFGVKVF
jgi:hypothetical protein